MKLSFEPRFKLAATVVVMTLMLICMFGDKEYYPFAPYTMYSYKHDIRSHLFSRYVCTDNESVVLTNSAFSPLDLARLSTSIQQDKDEESISEKLTEAKRLAIKNGLNCTLLKLNIYRYDRPENFFTKKEVFVKEYFSK